MLRGAFHNATVVEGAYVSGIRSLDNLEYNTGPSKWGPTEKTMIIGAKHIMPTFVVREPEKGPPIYVGDVFDHPVHTAVIVDKIDIDYRTMPVERVITFRAATRQELEENGYI